MDESEGGETLSAPDRSLVRRRTFLNGERMEAERYYQLLENDSFRVGHSSRSYVLIAEDQA